MRIRSELKYIGKTKMHELGRKQVCRGVNVGWCFLLWLKGSVKLKRKLQATGYVEN